MKTNKGYAILFAVVIVGIVSLISVGLSNTSFKQLILSSLVTDSQTAFYKADTASECGLYSFLQGGGMTGTQSDFSCGIDKDGDIYQLSAVGTTDGYTLNLKNQNDLNPCFKINIKKESSGAQEKVTITSDGYNICDPANSRSVEREIQIDFNI